MRPKPILAVYGAGLCLFVFLSAVSGKLQAQGFPMMSPGVPGMGSGFPGMGPGFGPGTGMPGFNRSLPRTGMVLPDFGRNFPDMNMTIPRFGNPGFGRGYAPDGGFSNPFNGFAFGGANTGTALYDIGFYRRGTGDYARIIMQAHMVGGNLFVRQCSQQMRQIAMECRTYINGRIIRVNYVRAPGRQARFLPPRNGDGFQVQGSGRWRGMEVTGTFQLRYNGRPYY